MAFKRLFIIINLLVFPIGIWACVGQNDVFFCEGDEVILPDGKAATVSGLGPNNTVIAHRFGAPPRSYKAHEIGMTEDCQAHHPFCVGTKIITPDCKQGYITAVRPDGRVFTNTVEGLAQDSKLLRPEELAVMKGCLSQDYCVGDSVVDERGKKGKISAITHNGYVRINYGHSESPSSCHWLAHASKVRVTAKTHKRKPFNFGKGAGKEALLIKSLKECQKLRTSLMEMNCAAPGAAQAVPLLGSLNIRLKQLEGPVSSLPVSDSELAGMVQECLKDVRHRLKAGDSAAKINNSSVLKEASAPKFKGQRPAPAASHQ